MVKFDLLHPQATCPDRESFDVFYIPRIIELCAQSLVRASDSAQSPQQYQKRDSSSDVCKVLISSEEPRHGLLASAIASLQSKQYAYPSRPSINPHTVSSPSKASNRDRFRIRVVVVDDAALHSAFVSLLPDAHAYVAAHQHASREGESPPIVAAVADAAYSVDSRLRETDAAAARSLGVDGRLYDVRYVPGPLLCTVLSISHCHPRLVFV